MVVAPGFFMHGRVTDLELITGGWRYMQRNMNEDEKKGFAKMINMPGFCVEKFEQQFLLKRINPFASNPESRNIKLGHEDCACGKTANDGRQIEEMKKTLSEFVGKWGQVLEELTSAGSSQEAQLTTKIVQKTDELQHEAEAKLKAIEKTTSPAATLAVSAPVTNSVTENKHAQNEKRENESKTSKNVGTAPKKKDASITKGRPEEKQPVPVDKGNVQDKDQNTVDNSKKRVNVPVESPIQTPIAQVQVDVSFTREAESASSSTQLQCETEKAPAEVKTTLTVCESETSSLSSPASTTSPIHVDKARSVGTPDSGMVSDLSEFKPVDVQKEEKKTIDPEKLTGRDGRRARQKKREAEKLAMEQQKLEEQTEEPTNIGATEVDSAESGVKTGKEKRRLKDKMRKEKKEQQKLILTLEEEKRDEPQKEQEQQKTDGPVQDQQSVNEESLKEQQSVNETSLKEQPSVNKESLKEPIETSQPPKEPLTETSQTTEITNPPQEKLAIESPPEEVAEKPAVQDSENTSKPKEEKQETEAVDETKQVVEADIADEFANSCSPDGDEPIAPLASEETFSSSEPTMQQDDQVQPRMSKGQKKRAKKRAKKGVYVVNQKIKPHSIELLPGEYKIVTIDQKDKKGETVTEINIDDAIEESKQHETRNSENEVYVTGENEQRILAEGHWLAYIINSKNGGPKIGEVSNDQVVETIKHLGSQNKLRKSKQEHQDSLSQSDESVGPNLVPPTNSPEEGCAPKYSTLPELDADFVRKTFAELENSGCTQNETLEIQEGAGEALSVTDQFEELPQEDPPHDDLTIFMEANGESDWRKVGFRSDFAQKTAPLFVGNKEFAEFCSKYSTSKYNRRVITQLIRKYIDTRIVFHFERFKKLADRESHRVSQCWTHVKESSAYALMVMLYINSPDSVVGFPDVENVLFPRLCCSRPY